MPSESLRDTPPQQDLLSATEKSDAEDSSDGDATKLPVELSEFT
jgi:hypothetical protein